MIVPASPGGEVGCVGLEGCISPCRRETQVYQGRHANSRNLLGSPATPKVISTSRRPREQTISGSHWKVFMPHAERAVETAPGWSCLGTANIPFRFLREDSRSDG